MKNVVRVFRPARKADLKVCTTSLSYHIEQAKNLEENLDYKV
jgi:hypothetical protein